MKYIEDYLTKLEPLEPIPTGFDKVVSRNSSIKAVLFDIYGTLLVSSSGDIDQASTKISNLKIALEETGIILKKSEYYSEEKILGFILEEFKSAIKLSHFISEENNYPFPEIDILRIWESVLLIAGHSEWIEPINNPDIRQLTMIFELLSNTIYPMPGMKMVLEGLQASGYPLGIVSNAQFYTPVFMNYFLNGELNYGESIDLFNADLSVFSYQEMRAKPDIELFNKILPALKNEYSIKPDEIIFVGNDMLNDIYTAHKAGVKTVLFAGDKRSLRIRGDRDEVKGLKPDYIITELSQLFEILD